MAQQHNDSLVPYEERVEAAVQAIKQDPTLSQRRAAAMNEVSESTVRARQRGRTARRDTHPNSSNLKKSEEESLIQHIKKLGARGFAPTLTYVGDMANQLLAARGEGYVGEKWVRNFVRRKTELKSQLTRQRDRQRVFCSDPGLITPWFELVQNVKAKYGILDEDIYNFDETGFALGVGNRVKVVTASERRTEAIGLQQGDREWVTLIAGINAMGWAIAPYFIFKAKNHDASWYPDLKPHWRIGVSDNGWTTNEIGLAWLKHFIEQIKERRVGSHVLLVIDGHESHKSLAFQDLCEENKIITLCMPPHSSHILQPLDVGCFAPLKRAYSREIRVLATDHVGHIDKKAFIASFAKVFETAFSKASIQSSFRATGLVPNDPLVVLSKLEVKPRTPTPPLPGTTQWNPKTPSNAAEVEAQSTLLRDRIQRHQGSSPSPIVEMVEQLRKGTEMILHSQTLLAARVLQLEASNRAASERKSRKRKRIQKDGDLSKEEAEDLMAQLDIEAQVEGEMRKGRTRTGAGKQRKRHCRRCGETGHNSRTCQKDRAGTSD
jgi:hypothetical protein